MIAVMACAAAVLSWTGDAERGGPPLASMAEASSPSLHEDKRKVSEETRLATLRRARIWRPPATPVSRAVFANRNRDTFTCGFLVSDLDGTTPKFECLTDDGEEIRVKYGRGPEIPAETAATRLMSALGFAADEVTLVRLLRCHGCPPGPFSTSRAVELTHTGGERLHL
jgi:hypothetical protein